MLSNGDDDMRSPKMCFMVLLVPALISVGASASGPSLCSQALITLSLEAAVFQNQLSTTPPRDWGLARIEHCLPSQPAEQFEPRGSPFDLSLYRLLLASEPPEPWPHEGGEFVLKITSIASLEASIDSIATLIDLIIANLGASDKKPKDSITLVFNLDGLNISSIAFKSRSIFALDNLMNLHLDSIILTISNDIITSEAELNPQDLTVQKGSLQIKFNLGTAQLKSTTTFEKDQGVTQQVIKIQAPLGDLMLTGQATFALDYQEFSIGASIAGLAFSSTSVFTPIGIKKQTFGLEFKF